MNAVCFFHRVNGDDVRMVQRRDRPGFALEPMKPLGRFRQLGREDLQRDLPAKLRVFREIDLTLPPAPIFSRIW